MKILMKAGKRSKKQQQQQTNKLVDFVYAIGVHNMIMMHAKVYKIWLHRFGSFFIIIFVNFNFM